ncbi:conserved protein of unknown function [Nitrospira defluvii]|jgi:hypothetical protein|uniref:Helix-turn-helix domain-containing protein n=1 Tax=Nitrospira defluvii TaxID=330214 RepID=D8P829_9BACT|nr:conserved protein of unknown function [Nitrospira defluvii]
MTLLTPSETAQFLRVSARTLRRLPVPRAKIGGQLRYDLADLEAWVRKQKQGMILDVTPATPLTSLPTPALIPAASPRPVKHRNPLFAIGGRRPT